MYFNQKLNANAATSVAANAIEKLGELASLNEIADKLEEVAEHITIGNSVDISEDLLEDLSDGELIGVDLSIKPVIDINPKSSLDYYNSNGKLDKIINTANDTNHFIVRSKNNASVVASQDNLYFSGEPWATASLANSRKGAILLKMAGHPQNAYTYNANGEKVTTRYGVVFRHNSDGLSFYGEKGVDGDTVTFTLKLYNTPTSSGSEYCYVYLDVNDVVNNRLLINYDIDACICDIYKNGELLKSAEDINPECFKDSHSISLGDDRKIDNSRQGYNLPMNLYEFKVFDRFLNKDEIEEAYNHGKSNNE